MAKGSKGASAGFGFRLMAYASLLICTGSAFWYWGLLPSGAALSESHQRLQKLSREHPEAEVFEAPSSR